mgnify:CR=1 FL=1
MDPETRDLKIVGVGIITSRFLDMDYQLACFVGLIGILVLALVIAALMKYVFFRWVRHAQFYTRPDVRHS